MEILRYVAGITAACLSCASGIVYVRAIWRRESKTRWSSWMIWMVTSFTSLATYYSSGARESVWVNVAYTVTCSTIFATAVWRRNAGGLTKVEIICLAGAALTGVVWWWSGSAVWGQVASVSTEVIAYVPIWMAARGENKRAWILETTGSVINMLAIPHMRFGLLLYPTVILVGSAIVVMLIYRPVRASAEPELELAPGPALDVS